MDPLAAASPLSILEAEKTHLEKAAQKLRESNAQLKAAMGEAAPEDAATRLELKAAFEENIPIIAKYTARAAALEEEIRRCKRAAGVVVEGDSGGGGGGGVPSEPARVQVEGMEEDAAPAPAPATMPGPPGAADGVWL